MGPGGGTKSGTERGLGLHTKKGQRRGTEIRDEERFIEKVIARQAKGRV